MMSTMTSIIPALRALERAIQSAEVANYSELSRRILWRAASQVSEESGGLLHCFKRGEPRRPVEGVAGDGEGGVTLVVNLSKAEARALAGLRPTSLGLHNDAREALLQVRFLLDSARFD